MNRRIGNHVTPELDWTDSMPERLAWTIRDGHRPSNLVGVSPYADTRLSEYGNWYPPPKLEDGLADALEPALARIDDLMEPAVPKFIIEELKELALVIPVWDRTPEEWEKALRQYVEDLQGVSESVFHQFCRDWRRSENRWPTIADCITHCNRMLFRGQTIKRRLWVLQYVGENPAPEGVVTSNWLHQVRVHVNNLAKGEEDRENGV